MQTLRTTLASYWTAGTAFVVMSALHLRWLHRSAHAGDVPSAYGAGLVVLGLLMAARPFLQTGVERMAWGDLPSSVVVYDGSPIDQFVAARSQVLIDEYQGRRDNIVSERVIAVLVVVIGTLINGWAAPFARRWGLPV